MDHIPLKVKNLSVCNDFFFLFFSFQKLSFGRLHMSYSINSMHVAYKK